MQKRSKQLKRKRKPPIDADTILANLCEPTAIQQELIEGWQQNRQALQVLIQNANVRARAIQYGDHAYITQEEE